MTQDEITRYFELPEEFRYDDLGYNYVAQIWLLGRYETAFELTEDAAELIAIASMLVGLRKAGRKPQLEEVTPAPVWCLISVRYAWGDESKEFSAPSDFLALLSACEHVAKAVQP